MTMVKSYRYYLPLSSISEIENCAACMCVLCIIYEVQCKDSGVDAFLGVSAYCYFAYKVGHPQMNFFEIVKGD